MRGDNRELIERTRKVNKTLSLFVFALQEDAAIPTDSQLSIANLLIALAEVIRARAAQQAATTNLVIGEDDRQPPALEPSQQTDNGP